MFALGGRDNAVQKLIPGFTHKMQFHNKSHSTHPKFATTEGEA